MPSDYKFHIHDEQQRKNSDSFGKIKEAIVLNIQKKFDNCMDTAESISSGTIRVFDENELQESSESNKIKGTIKLNI